MTNPICCGKEAQYYEDVTIAGGEMAKHGLTCSICNNMAAEDDYEMCKNLFLENAKPAPKQVNKVEKKETKPSGNAGYNKGEKVSNNNSLTVSAPKQLMDFFGDTKALSSRLMPMFTDNVGSFERLLELNKRYVANNENLVPIWQSEEGIASIMYNTEEAILMKIELGKMGELVPFGKVCQLIPDVVAYETNLKNGKNAPFKDIRIICIYENDNLKITNNKNDGFNYDLEQSFPRGEIAGVLVYAEKKNGMAIGEFYDAERLMAKAEAHSVSYQRYLVSKEALDLARSNNAIKKWPSGDEYIDVGQNKVAVKNIKNPYDGPDKPEMLRKAAGKSFLAPYMKVRNSEAAMEEVKSSEDAKDRAFSDIVGDVEEME